METFNKLSKYIDANIRLRTGILVVCIVSILLAIIMGTANPIGDFWTHYSWMKITHRLPVSKWYDNNASHHLDYPHVAAYIHYLMGFIVSFFDPQTFYNTGLYDDFACPFAVKYGMRFAILLTNIIFYYPAAISVVLLALRKHKVSTKFGVIFLLLNMPMYTYIDYGHTQVNGPHLGLLLWCIYFTMKHRFYAATICFSFSIGYKHFNGPFVIPIACYMIVHLWKLAAESPGAMKVMKVVFECSKIAVVGLLTVFVSLLPMIRYPGAIATMLRVLFPIRIRGFIHPAPTFWNAINHLMAKADLEENRDPFIPVPFLIQLLTGLILFVFLMNRPKKSFFLTSFTMYSMVSYLFGYSVHEKHLQYTFLTFLLQPVLFNKLYSVMMMLSVIALYPIACDTCNSGHILIFGFAISYVTYLFQQSIKEESKDEYSPVIPGTASKAYTLSIHLLNWFNRKSGKITTVVLSGIIALLGVHGNAILFHGYHCLYEEGMLEDFMYKFGFIGLFIVFLWMWLVTIVEGIQDDRKRGD